MDKGQPICERAAKVTGTVCSGCSWASSAHPDPADGPVAAVSPVHALSPFSALISRYMFHEGEIIELVARPSAWWLLFSSWRTLLLCAAVILAGLTFAPGRSSLYIELGVMGGLARLMWATVKWMSRIHVLTNMRVMTVSGVFNVVVVECPLRRLSLARVVSPFHERMLLLGSLELLPADETFPTMHWQTIRRAAEVYRKVQAAIARSRQNGAAAGA